MNNTCTNFTNSRMAHLFLILSKQESTSGSTKYCLRVEKRGLFTIAPFILLLFTTLNIFGEFLYEQQSLYQSF